MKQLTIISGKGGTGKTTMAGSFAVLAQSKVMADCDVDAADLHLLLHPEVRREERFEGQAVAVIDEETCIQCDRCVEACRFDAIHDYVVDPVACEGCTLCRWVCPAEAVEMEETVSGSWFISDTRYGPMVHAKLDIAQENSGKLVTMVRQQARLIAEREDLNYVLIDGPPGIGCPVISSITGVDRVLAVTEPTLSGIHDLERILGVAAHFGIGGMVCINKYDLNRANTDAIRRFCDEKGFPVVGEVPFDPVVVDALVNTRTPVEMGDGPVAEEIRRMWDRVHQVLSVS